MATFHENLVQSFANFKNKYITSLNTNTTWYGTSSTAASTAAKVATTTDSKFTLTTGAKVRIKFTYANTASNPTLNVDSGGAHTIKAYGTTTPTVWWNAGDVVEFTYDGTNFIMGATQGEIEKLNSYLANKQDKLTDPLTKADVVNNLTTSKTNIPLSAAQGKKLGAYPKIFNVIGQIANADGDAFAGYGVATVILYASGLAKIEYQYTITTAGSSTATSNFKWGLNRDLLSANNPSIPTITPVNGGVATWYDQKGNTWSAFNDTLNGYGCSHSINSVFWCAARNHNRISIGAFPVSAALLNARICGTCYGTFTVT